MALTVTENFRMTAGGRAWRMITVVHDSATKSLTAASIDLTYIDAIVGVNHQISMVAVASNVIDVMNISIGADNAKLIWASSAVCTQNITVVGW